MKLLKNLYMKMQAVKVVHSLPGRLRLQIPGLKSVSPQYYFLEEEFITAFSTLPGVNKIELSPVSGRALIQYDGTRFDDRVVLGWIKGLWQVLAQHMAQLDRSKSDEELLDSMRREFQIQLEIVKNEFVD